MVTSKNKYVVNGNKKHAATTPAEHRTLLDRLLHRKSVLHVQKRTAKSQATITPAQLLHLVRRVVIFAAAVLYLTTCFRAINSAVEVLRGQQNPFMDFVPYEAPLITSFVGRESVRSSALLQQLGNDTTPRNDTLFLTSSSTTSFESCPASVTVPERMYTNAFIRMMFTALQRGAGYNLTLLDATEAELVVPVVDCGFGGLVTQDSTAARYFFLLRRVNDTDDVHLLVMSLSIQDYKIQEQNENGPAGVATLAFILDGRATTVDHHFALSLGYPYEVMQFEAYQLVETTAESYWLLESVPPDTSVEAPKLVLTALRTGMYIQSETEQSNIKNTIWSLENDPLAALRWWRWQGRPVLRDSWAWVHCLQLVLATDMLFSLIVLFLVIYQNARKHRFWVGDAFVSFSTTLTVRALLVVVTWYINGYWTLIEFCVYDANKLFKIQGFYIYEGLLQADLMTIYLGCMGMLGMLLKERIDPALATFLFQIGFSNRHEIARWFPQTLEVVRVFGNMDFMLGIRTMNDRQALISPMRLWTIHPIPTHRANFIAASLWPIFSTFIVAIVYVLARKIYRVFVPEKIIVQKVTGFSEDETTLLTNKRTLTLFEIATGATLQARYGLVSDYDDCMFIKGMKYASADGIYCSGYVIVNGKCVVATEDLKAILLMRLTLVRFTNIYAYDLEGSSVQQTARLIYPTTLSFYDIVHLNITVLS